MDNTGVGYLSKPLQVVVILGTVRQGRSSERVARFVLKELLQRPECSAELVDVREYSFPKDDYGVSIKPAVQRFQEAVTRADALIIISPEYNHGYPGSLKTFLDSLYPEYARKAVSVVGVSSGPWGGVRMVENLLPVLRELGLYVTRLGLNIPNAEELFSEDGEPQDAKQRDRLTRMLDELFWLAAALRHGRSGE